jgi:hypothetical protein
MRSKFEVSVSKKLKGCNYEPKEHIMEYFIEGTYLPDFVPKKEPNVLIEVKGRFRTRQEAKKYVAVRANNPTKTVVFIFMDPDKPMPGARRRKDGTRLSHGEWATLNDFEHYTIKTIPLRWCKK